MGIADIVGMADIMVNAGIVTDRSTSLTTVV
jgi:hypothetical protein